MDQAGLLPDFCRPLALFFVLILGLLLAAIITLAGPSPFENFWTRLGSTGLAVTVISLPACAFLCLARPWLVRQSPAVLWTSIFVTIQGLGLLTSLVAASVQPDQDIAGFVLRNQLISAIVVLILLRYLALYRDWRLQVQADSRLRLDALQARIRPHFLFNALNTIASLIRARPADAEQAVLDLSDLLRSGLREGSRHALADEIDLIRGYLRIEALRLGERLKVDWRMAEDLSMDLEIPALLIQPLVENAIVHGISQLDNGGTLTISGRVRRGGGCTVSVQNPVPESASMTTNSGANMALENIRQRLALGFEGRARLITRREGGQFHAELRMPAV